MQLPDNYLKQVERYLQAKDAYYNGQPFMTDAEFDQLERDIESANPDELALTLVGSPVKSEARNVKHSTPMLSTDKALNPEALQNWADRHQPETLVGSAKLDGVACDLHYQEGVLVKASSRGNGTMGTDVTAKVRHVVPSGIEVSAGRDIHIRGEMVISFENFDKLNALLKERGEEALANPRNAVAGLVVTEEALDPEKLAHITFVAYRVIGFAQRTHLQELDYLHNRGFETPMQSTCAASFIKTDAEGWDNARAKYKYPIDGVVYRVNNEQLFLDLGTTSKFHKGAVAYKFAPDKAIVTIKSIEWSCGTKDICPVAVLEPVSLDGAIIGRVALHSVKNMVFLKAAPGRKVLLVRSGGVIPHAQPLP